MEKEQRSVTGCDQLIGNTTALGPAERRYVLKRQQQEGKAPWTHRLTLRGGMNMGNWGQLLLRCRPVLALGAGVGRWVRTAALSYPKRGTVHLYSLFSPVPHTGHEEDEPLQVLQFSSLTQPGRGRCPSFVPFLHGIPAVEVIQSRRGLVFGQGWRRNFWTLLQKFSLQF